MWVAMSRECGASGALLYILRFFGFKNASLLASHFLKFWETKLNFEILQKMWGKLGAGYTCGEISIFGIKMWGVMWGDAYSMWGIDFMYSYKKKIQKKHKNDVNISHIIHM
jgi:hypothetical protein